MTINEPCDRYDCNFRDTTVDSCSCPFDDGNSHTTIDPLEELRETDRWMNKKFYDRIADAWQAEREANKRSETFGVMSIEHLQSKLDATRKENDACEAAQTSNVEEIAALQAKLDASIPLPLDADGIQLKVGSLFTLYSPTVREVRGIGNSELVDADGNWFLTNECHHVAPKPETIEDVRKEANDIDWGTLGDDTSSGAAESLIDRAYECGKRDGGDAS